MVYKQEKMRMQNQKRYSSNLNWRPCIRGSLFNLYLLIVPFFLVSCQRRIPMVSHPIRSDSINAKVLGNKKEGEIFIKNTLTINDTTHLPQTNNIAIYRDGKIVQTIMYQYDWDSYGFPMDKDSIGKTELVDVNFDGIKDVLIYKGAFGNQGIQYFDCYLWNKQKEKYTFIPSFSNIGNPVLDKKHSCIFSLSRENANCYIYEKFQFINGIFKPISVLTEKIVNNEVIYELERNNEKRRKKISTKAELREWENVVK